MAIYCKIVDSHAIQIHSSNTVIIGGIAARFTAEDMPLLVAIRLFRMATDRTSLARITRIYVDDGTLIKSGLVLQFLLKVVEGP